MATVSVLIPAYNCENFIEDTLDSLFKQTYSDFEVIISIDQSTDSSFETILEWYSQHSDIKLVIHHQKVKLGWVRNCNYLLSQCNSEYFMIMPHDDVLMPNYIERLLCEIVSQPGVCTVYSDIGILNGDGIITQRSIKGNKLERIKLFLLEHFNAVAFRGIVRSEVFGPDKYIPENRNHNSYGLDTVWNLKMVLKGDIIRIPEVLYKKRFHEKSAHAEWKYWDDERKLRTWSMHCIDCAKVLKDAKLDRDEYKLLTPHLTERLLQRNKPLAYYSLISSLSEENAAEFVSSYTREVNKFWPNTSNQD